MSLRIIKWYDENKHNRINWVENEQNCMKTASVEVAGLF